VSLLNTVRFVLQHPLGRAHPVAALARFARWQFASRVGFGPNVVPYVEDAHLIVSRGMTGATGNVYVGLHEYDDMAFILHLLRPGDLFVDIGANIGAYTILAAKAAGARCVSIEPLPTTFAHLENNIHYNRVGDLVDARNVGLAADRRQLRFSANLDTMNHVVDESYDGPYQLVDVLSLDELLDGRVPFAMKIDVEGFERQVLAGASRTLAAPGLQAILVEVNDHQDRYGDKGKTARDTLRDAGFAAYRYDARERSIIADDHCSPYGNYLFVRNAEMVSQRVATSRRYRVGPWTV
jgi:FkbM family methyltransferase